MNGFQLVLIGDLQEIPFIHLATDEFQIAINDWSGDVSPPLTPLVRRADCKMRMATSMTTSIRYFNPSNSYFEPLLDPWKFDFKVSRVSAGPDNNPMDVSFTSRQRLELNISAAFIELMLSGMAAWGQGQERLRSERGTDAPFRIRNLTGKQLALWCESRDPNKPPTGVKLLDDGGDVPWRFEDRRTSRDVSVVPCRADDRMYRELATIRLVSTSKTPLGRQFAGSRSTVKASTYCYYDPRSSKSPISSCAISRSRTM